MLAIAVEAARKAYPTSMTAESLGFATLKADDERPTWSVATQTLESQLIDDLDDASGDVPAIRRAGIRWRCREDLCRRKTPLLPFRTITIASRYDSGLARRVQSMTEPKVLARR